MVLVLLFTMMLVFLFTVVLVLLFTVVFVLLFTVVLVVRRPFGRGGPDGPARHIESISKHLENPPSRCVQAAESEAAELPGRLLCAPAQLLPAPHPALEAEGAGRGGGPGPRGEPGPGGESGCGGGGGADGLLLLPPCSGGGVLILSVCRSYVPPLQEWTDLYPSLT